MIAAYKKLLVSRLKSFSWKDWIAVALVVAAAVLRLYNLEGSQQFLGDQGRDSMVVSRIFREGDPVFIGPVTSIGNMYLGPFYYYFMLPFLWMNYPSPMGPIYAVAALGIVTVALFYYIASRMIGKTAALIGTFLFTFSSTAITFTRFSWNPNPAPFFSLLMVYFTYLAWKKNTWYWVAVAAAFSILIQLHYVTLLTAGGAGIIWLISLYQSRSGEKLRTMLRASAASFLVVLVSMLPLILFDMKHDWLNANAFLNIFIKEEAFSGSSSSGIAESIMALAADLKSRSSFALIDIYFGEPKNKVLVLAAAAVVLGAWFRKSLVGKNSSSSIVLMSYLLVTIIGITFYSHEVYSHYITYIFPVVFMIAGAAAAYLLKLNKYFGVAVVSLMLLIFLQYNFAHMPYHDAGWQINDISRTADTIAERVQPGEKYNIVLLSETRDLYGQNYRYFLTTHDGKEPINPEREVEVDTLFVINEERVADDVTELPIYQIRIFPDKEPEEVYSVPGGPEITVFRSTSANEKEE